MSRRRSDRASSASLVTDEEEVEAREEEEDEIEAFEAVLVLRLVCAVE